MMPITLLYAGLLGLIYLVLTMRVIRRRQTGNINLGHGNDAMMERRIRAHGNFAEYVPFLLVLMGLLEQQQVSAHLLHGFGIALVAARGLHGYALAYTEKWFPGRFYGTLLTLIVLALSSLAAVYVAIF